MQTRSLNPAPARPVNVGKLLALVVFLLAVALVLLNVFTPLRLNNDAGRYLGILEYLKGGLSKNSDAAHDFLPHGYPYYLLILEKIHFLSPFTITLTNILSMLIASCLIAKEFVIRHQLLYMSLVLICFINIKQYTLPVSDQLFTLTFILAIYLWSKSFKGNLYYLAPALIITLISIFIRTAGVAIIIGLMAYLVFLNKDRIIKKKVLLGFILLATAAFAVFFIMNLAFFEKKVDYVRQLNLEQINRPANIAGRLSIHFKELGEILINIPDSKLSAILNIKHIAVASIVLVIAGIMSLFIYVKAVAKLKLIHSFPFWVFAGYLLMIFLWPFYDTRFLIPILPLLMYLYFYYLFSLSKSRYLKFALLIVYVSFGIISLVYSDALSLNKRFFLAHYGADPYLTNMYRAHFNSIDHPVNGAVYNIHKDYLPFLLQEYDRKPLYYFSKK